jgi:hypothetical protein
MGAGGVREALEYHTWLMQAGVRYLTCGSNMLCILSDGGTDVKRIGPVPLG